MFFEHNIETYNEFEPIILQHHECCIVAAMGVGKTDISIEFIKKFNLNTLVIVPKVDIGTPWQTLANMNGVSVSTITYHSFSRNYTVLNGFDCYIFDEAHHMDSAVWGKSIRSFRETLDENAYIIGLTGDPIRYFDSCKNVVDTMFNGNAVYGHSQYEAILEGILPPITYVCAIYDTDSLYEEYYKKATTEELRGKLKFVHENCMKINDILKMYAPDNSKGFVFVDKIKSIQTGIDIASKAFPDKSVRYAHSKMPKNERNDNIDAFRNDDTGFMVAVDIFNEGHHIKGTNVVIMLRKTGSPTIYFQQIGRGMSANDKTNRAVIFDFVGNKESIKSIDKRISIINSMLSGDEKKSKNKSETTDDEDKQSNQVIVCDKARSYLEVIEEIDWAYTNRRWTPEEDQILRDNYPTMGSKVAELLPGRSEQACHTRANYLGIKSIYIWTSEEDQILKDNYPTMGSKVAELLPGRSEQACRWRANYLKIKTTIYIWTSEEDQILRDNYPTMGCKVAELLPGRSEQACRVRAAKYLNIKFNNGTWTPEEDQILSDNYPTMGTDVHKLLPNRTKTACLARVKILNLKSNSTWTPEEDQILRDNYLTMGCKVAELLPGRTEKACRTRANRLGIKLNISWTPEEDQILKDNYPTIGGKVVELLPGRSEQACRERANKLEIKEIVGRWSPEEDQILKDNYPSMGSKVAELLPGRSEQACRARANKLGIKNRTK